MDSFLWGNDCGKFTSLPPTFGNFVIAEKSDIVNVRLNPD